MEKLYTQNIQWLLTIAVPRRSSSCFDCIAWPAWSPNLKFCDFWLMGYLRSKFFVMPYTIVDLMKRKWSGNATLMSVQRVMVNFHKRLKTCIYVGGELFYMMLYFINGITVYIFWLFNYKYWFLLCNFHLKTDRFYWTTRLNNIKKNLTNCFYGSKSWKNYSFQNWKEQFELIRLNWDKYFLHFMPYL